MPRFTIVYSDFSSRVKEVNILRRTAYRLEHSKDSFRHGPEIAALCRGAVVLLSSHIEAYIKELGEHTLDSIYAQTVCRSRLAPQFFFHVSKEAIENVREASQPEKIALNVQGFIDAEAKYWASIGPLPTPIESMKFNKGFSNPKFDKVKAYFGRFGYTDFRRDFYRELGKSARIVENGLDQIVETRNAIAHGDPSATKTPKEIKELIETSRVFCRTCDTIFGAWCRKNLCNIR